MCISIEVSNIRISVVKESYSPGVLKSLLKVLITYATKSRQLITSIYSANIIILQQYILYILYNHKFYPYTFLYNYFTALVSFSQARQTLTSIAFKSTLVFLCWFVLLPFNYDFQNKNWEIMGWHGGQRCCRVLCIPASLPRA